MTTHSLAEIHLPDRGPSPRRHGKSLYLSRYTRAREQILDDILTSGGLVERYKTDPAFHHFVEEIVNHSIRVTLDVCETPS
jgi:hypothetical protein